MGQNGQKLEFWAVNSLQLGFSLSKSVHLGCYGHLDIVKKNMQKKAGLFVALRIFCAPQGAQNGQKSSFGLVKLNVN